VTDLQGQRIDNYRLIQLLGTGQFGEVYLAEPTGSQTLVLVAIKILRPLAQDDQRDLLRFLREVRAAQLKHEHIVQVYDFGVEGNMPFIVMEYAPNGTLRQRHPTGTPVPLPTIVAYVQQVASALQYMHDKRFIHRDIKPANMLIGEQGQILLSDFGIATLSHSTLSQSQEDMAGTIPYIAPEQINRRARPASDQYALAVVVYEWLCGHCPFQGTIDEIMQKHQTAPPPPLSAQILTISSDVERVVMRALAKDPKQRFDRIEEFADALEQASQPVPRQITVPVLTPFGPGETAVTMPSPPLPADAVQGSTRASRISRRTVVLGCIIAGSVVVVGSLAWLYAKPPNPFPPPTPSPTPQPTPSPTPTPIPLGSVISTYKGHSGFVNAAAWSPDSKRIASGSDDRTVQVWQVADGGLISTYKGRIGAVDTVVWSPDGKRIASGSSDKTVQVWQVADSGLIFEYKGHTDVVDTVAWSPDGKRIASGSYDRTVQVWDATDGSLVLTYKGHVDAVRMVAWSPDGKRIASGSFDGTVQVWGATDGSLPSTYKGHVPDIVQAVAWLPDGKRIASAGNDGTVQVWDAANTSLVLTYRGHVGVVNAVAWSPDGKRIASGGVDDTVQVWNALNGAQIFTYHQHALEVRVVAWSPDGRLIVSGSGDQTVQVWGAG
jgi:eukaryotic-like serine/threonine-protein kinase